MVVVVERVELEGREGGGRKTEGNENDGGGWRGERGGGRGGQGQKQRMVVGGKKNGEDRRGFR